MFQVCRSFTETELVLTFGDCSRLDNINCGPWPVLASEGNIPAETGSGPCTLGELPVMSFSGRLRKPVFGSRSLRAAKAAPCE